MQQTSCADGVSKPGSSSFFQRPINPQNMAVGQSVVLVGHTGCFYTVDNLALPAYSGSPTLALAHIRVKLICRSGNCSMAVADLGGVRGVQMHPPLAASNVFLRT